MEPQQAPQTPATPQMPPQQAPQMAAVNPGQGLGIASLVCALLGISLVGLILGIIAQKKSKEAGMSNGMALAGIIISSIGLVVAALYFVLVIIGIAAGGLEASTY